MENDYEKRIQWYFSVFFLFLFLKVDPKEVKCLLLKISKCIKIKPATLRVIIMIVIIDKRFFIHDDGVLKGGLVFRVWGERGRSNKLFSISLSTKNTVALVCVCDRYECSNN